MHFFSRLWQWIRISVLIFTSLIALAFISPHKGYADPLMSNTNQATVLIQQGLFREAEFLLLSNLKVNPAHSPSIVLLGKVLYRQERYSDAAKQFINIDVNTLDPDTAFEYGVSMYGAKRCNQAIAGFIRVPKSHYLQSYARFYSGVCYLQKGDNTKALIKLKKATGLPPLLNSLRRHLIAVARKNVEGGQNLAAVTPNESIPVVPAPSQAVTSSQAATKQGQKDPKTAAKAPPPPPSLPLSVSLTPNAEIKATNSVNDFGGLAPRVDDRLAIEKSYSATLNSKYTFSPGSKNSAYINLDAKSSRHLIDADTIKDNKTTGTSEKGGKEKVDDITGVVSPSVNFQIGSKTDITGKYSYEQLNSRYQVTMSHDEFSTALHSSFDGVDFTTEGKYGGDYDKKQKPQLYATTISASIVKSLKPIEVSLNAARKVNATPDGSPLSGPADETIVKMGTSAPLGSFTLSTSIQYRYLGKPPHSTKIYFDYDQIELTTLNMNLEKTFDFGLTLKLKASHNVYYDLWQEVENIAKEKVATGVDAKSTSFGASLAQQIYETLYINVSGEYQTTVHTAKEVAYAEKLKELIPERGMNGELAIGIQKTF